MNSVWHCPYKQRTHGHALIAAIILAGVSALLLLSGLNRILYQSKLAAGIDSRQQLHAAARHSLYQATLTAESAEEFPRSHRLVCITIHGRFPIPVFDTVI